MPSDQEATFEQIVHPTKTLGLVELIAAWNARNPTLWSRSIEPFRTLGERILEMGEPLLAYDVLHEGLSYFPEDFRLRQLLASALARTGAVEPAITILLRLYQEGHRDEETLGLLGSSYKKLAEAAADTPDGNSLLRRARKFYAEAYELTHGYWSGINVATLTLALCERGQAESLARDVRETCSRELQRLKETKADPYWLLAVLGESALILGNWSEAEGYYRQASEIAGNRFGDLHSTRLNARLLLAHLDGDQNRIESCFKIPSVIMFAGHMIDTPDRTNPRFPPDLEAAVRDSLRHRLKSLEAGFGYCSLACGSDILFAETILEMGGEIQIVLPYEKDQFIRDSVEIIPGSNWGDRCEAILQKAAGITLASNQCLTGSTVQFEYSNLLLFGLAIGRAERLGSAPIPLAVWDGKAGNGPGGTAWTVDHWRGSGFAVEIIRLDEIFACHCPDRARQHAARPETTQTTSPTSLELTPAIHGLLFADAVGFSKLGENEVALFVRHFLGVIGELVQNSPYAPVLKNTWGDGLYFVFASVRDAGNFALDVRDHIAAIDWKKKGLPDLSLRIGLHAGPVYPCVDPVTQRPNYIGVHVSRAARIEPVTPPGQIYASQAFAALAAASRIEEFRCDYVGQTALAKYYGTFPTYIVLRRPPAIEQTIAS
jgi:class 3 adenylate cyclase